MTPREKAYLNCSGKLSFASQRRFFREETLSNSISSNKKQKNVVQNPKRLLQHLQQMLTALIRGKTWPSVWCERVNGSVPHVSIVTHKEQRVRPTSPNARLNWGSVTSWCLTMNHFACWSYHWSRSSSPGCSDAAACGTACVSCRFTVQWQRRSCIVHASLTAWHCRWWISTPAGRFANVLRGMCGLFLPTVGYFEHFGDAW